MNTNNQRVALVTGANKGLGFEVARELSKQGIDVVMASRDRAKIEQSARNLKSENLYVTPLTLDVCDIQSCKKAFDYINKTYGKLDILVNNAGVYLDGDKDISQLELEIFEQTMATNVNGAFYLTRLFLPMMTKQKYGRIVNVSSGMGQLSGIGRDYASYKISKATLNLLTRAFADSVNSKEIKINSVCPGWVRTEMGGANAPRSVEKGAETIVWAATLPPNGASGKFFRDMHEIEW